MDLVQLTSFVEVAERGTVAAAAAALGYTAPAVSQHLAKLEASLGTTLFDRVGGRLTLTTAGATLRPIAVDMLDLEARARADVGASNSVRHVVFAGFASAISTVLIPQLDLLRSHATVEIHESEDTEALRDLGLGRVDVVLTQEYEGFAAERNRRFVYTPLISDRLRLVLPPRMPATTTVEQLGDEPWLLNGQGTRCAQATMAILSNAGITPHVAATVADNSTLLALVAAGHGATIVPERVLDDLHHRVTLADQALPTTRTIHAVTRRATHDSLAAILDLLSLPGPVATTPGRRGAGRGRTANTRR